MSVSNATNGPRKNQEILSDHTPDKVEILTNLERIALFGFRQAAAGQSRCHRREQAPRRGSRLDQGKAGPTTTLQSSSGGTATIKPEAGHSKEPRPANRRSRQIELENPPPR